MAGRRLPASIAIPAAIAILATACYFALFRGRHREAEVPDTPTSITLWLCDECAAAFELTARQTEEGIRESRSVSVDGTARSELLIRCPRCGKTAARRAHRCPNDGTVIPLSRNGKRPPCPKCGWKGR
jgi:hypothetical protein